ncbi:DUF3558 domain-containing protein [Actinophytocola sp.]|uniref:DUF3558 domain-containing protein n=1 Tax=Actinophytocola sp. TaxID=1872138 RepID=UPI002ED306D6
MLTAVACNSATAGKPESTDTSSQPSEEPSSESTSEPEEPDYSLARLCELLAPEEAEQLGGSAEGEEGNSITDGHDICTWQNETYLIVGYQPGLTSANVATGPGVTNTPTTIDGLTGVQSREADPPGCQVLVDLPSGKLLGVSAGPLSAGEGKYEACDLANQLANLIIPRVKDQ